MKKIISCAFLALGFLGLQAQDLPKIIPPSPNAASLAQYVEIPVSHYTGLPNINIPFYTATSGSIQVPISLSYHARGVKLADLASSYGLGWSLNAGGVISRQIRGNADDTSNGYLNQNYYDTFWDDNQNGESTRSVAYSLELSGQFDRMPDQFTFNFLGFSGKFIFDRDNIDVPILQSFDDLKIEPIRGNTTSSAIEGFVITDSQGTKYHFGEYLSTTNVIEKDITLEHYTYTYDDGLEANTNPTSNRATSWSLLKIIALNGDEVTFEYEKEEAITYRKSEEVAEKAGSGNGFVKTAYYSKVKLIQQKIKKIIFSQGEVVFNYSFVRDDLIGVNSTVPKALSYIEVKNKIGVGERIKKHVFDYVYTTSTETTNIINDFNSWSPESKKRLFLNSIKEQGTDNSFLTPYKFTYDSQVLPSRLSSSHDRWGFYNGKSNGVFAAIADSPSERTGIVIDTVKVQASILTKVEYPTGGFAEYEYESNRAVFPEHMVGSVSFEINNPTETKTEVLDKDASFYNNGVYSVDFTVENIVPVYVSGAGHLNTAIQLIDPDCTNVESNDCDYMIRIHKQSDNSVYAILHNTTTSIPIENGDYILKVIPLNPSNENPNDGGDDFGLQLQWEESLGDLIYTGGNRIKRTILKDGEGNTIEKNYDYTFPSGTTSGKVFSFPGYHAYYYITTQGGQQVKVLSQVNFRPANTLTLEQGNHGGYAMVTEYIGNETNNIGKNEYNFSAFYDGGKYYTPPYHLPDNREWLRGRLISSLNYKNNENGAYELVRETKNVYDFVYFLERAVVDDPFLDSITSPRTFNKVKLIVFGKEGLGIPDPGGHNDYVTFTLSSGVVKLESTEVINYYDTGTKVDYTEYNYDFDNHYQIKKVKTFNSKGESIVKEYTYPQDKTTLTVAEDTLKQQHQFLPLETFSYKNSDLLSYSYTNYSDSLLPGLTVVGKVETAKGTGTSEDRIVFHGYYNDGKVKEVSKKDGTHIVYIWGYSGELPIAKIENATFTDIPTSVYNDVIAKSKLDVSETTENNLRTALATLRNHANLANSMVTTFTYDPLVGVTSITDPRGQTVYYDYDEFNRLKEVKDVDGKILSHNKYHYKGQ